jgi:hypothetical protein
MVMVLVFSRKRNCMPSTCPPPALDIDSGAYMLADF